VVQVSDIGSRQALGAIGKVQLESDERDGYQGLVYESIIRENVVRR